MKGFGLVEGAGYAVESALGAGSNTVEGAGSAAYGVLHARSTSKNGRLARCMLSPTADVPNLNARPPAGNPASEPRLPRICRTRSLWRKSVLSVDAEASPRGVLRRN